MTELTKRVEHLNTFKRGSEINWKKHPVDNLALAVQTILRGKVPTYENMIETQATSTRISPGFNHSGTVGKGPIEQALGQDGYGAVYTSNSTPLAIGYASGSGRGTVSTVSIPVSQ
mgnify:CR=1 FL=1